MHVLACPCATRHCWQRARAVPATTDTSRTQGHGTCVRLHTNTTDPQGWLLAMREICCSCCALLDAATGPSGRHTATPQHTAHSTKRLHRHSALQDQAPTALRRPQRNPAACPVGLFYTTTLLCPLLSNKAGWVWQGGPSRKGYQRHGKVTVMMTATQQHTTCARQMHTTECAPS